MKIRDFLSLSYFGVKTILFKQKKPILGTIILTDYCNLSCKHCSVNNINKKMYAYVNIKKEMEAFYREGIRILFFCGGETLLWKDGERDIRDLVKEAKKIGFYIVNIVTNGTEDLHIPEADIIFLSLDGTKKTHDLIRGDTYDLIMKRLEDTEDCNICIYMAINKLNYREVEEVAALAKEHPKINSISFNFHTPYEGTEDLSLDREEKKEVVAKIKAMIKKQLPIFNLYSSLEAYLKNQWDRPCFQCIVSEDNKRYTCGRCVEIEGLCSECGYLFAVEFSLLFKGSIKIIYEMLKTYLRYV
ncbi:radical SAM superfamily protein [Clostridium aceticum]|uniref:Radical SAM superfamily protein n=1 Tax=Clostridium aceticum TaxID=84022 RepID=A0A0D8ID62_9CLOT|nr:radical SAM protein [Clostridium aceticum]AKL95908.1 radical SAM superfamily protein [Clostridium aceticum]KJF27136.1 metallo cofactor biosynthesis protein [Clostridium aceticum]